LKRASKKERKYFFVLFVSSIVAEIFLSMPLFSKNFLFVPKLFLFFAVFYNFTKNKRDSRPRLGNLFFL